MFYSAGHDVFIQLAQPEKTCHSKHAFSLEKIIKAHKKVTLHVHPFVAAYLEKGFPSIRSKWFFEHKKWVKIIPRDAYTYLEYHFFDDKGKAIK